MIRFDYLKIGKTSITPQGYLRIADVPVSRADCVLTYHTTDGRVRKEFRPKESIFSADSLDTLKSAPVVIGHPGRLVRAGDPDKGHTTENVHTEGTKVLVDLVIKDPATIADVQSNKLRYISPGYTCDFDEKSGVFGDEKFDASQINVVYNHIGLLGTVGRQGKELEIRLDSALDEIVDNGISTENMEKKNMKVKVRFDGIEYEIDVPDANQASLLSQLAARLDSTEKKRDELSGQVAAQDKNITDLTAALTAAKDPAFLEALLQARLDAVEELLVFNPKTDRKDLAKKSVREIRLDTMRAAGFAEDYSNASDDFINGALAGIKNMPKPATDGISNAGSGYKNVKTDSEDIDPEKAKMEMRERTAKRYLGGK